MLQQSPNVAIADGHPNSIEPLHGARAVAGFRLSASTSPAAETCWVVSEDALTVDIEGVGSYMLMWTATEDAMQAVGFIAPDGVLGSHGVPEVLALAAGFAFTEGIIAGLDDIRSMAICPDRTDIVRVQLKHPGRVRVARRNIVVTSSCGVCGGRDKLDGALVEMPPVPHTLQLSSTDFLPFMAEMRHRQTVFTHTGGAHAAALFSADGQLQAFAEDLGRHNALDKVIGKCMLEGRNLKACIAVLSSRLSYELVAKAARAGIEVVAAVSAPSSLAIEIAQRCGITLCGFVRNELATVYSHPERIKELARAKGEQSTSAATADGAVRDTGAL
ncbi:MAG: formate dehydrogenase accessory sulfurtransferase FdhD [Glaciimonas sp.]|nr:formate dehydrogenase accessory sulfurtransferase FdhD [Glaciimonas sp.]